VVLLGDALIFSSSLISESDKSLYATLMVFVLIVLFLGNMIRVFALIKECFRPKKSFKTTTNSTEAALGGATMDGDALTMSKSLLVAQALQKFTNSKDLPQVDIRQMEDDGYFQNDEFLHQVGRVLAGHMKQTVGSSGHTMAAPKDITMSPNPRFK
jgi:hypothetical protein